ncbi:MAG: FIG00635939: hypothetical protein [uncultured Sphingosinicella sp.]|uniref:Right handed beta helix domain-containing protein n=1 Tax=uncultured Sphingosinicella sp. TaxID=478748 RepID=A0A6J4TDA6_9SPHN|nr:right-handed parallel beta-helix repeat-containing protein [uncultured Sphingosinicella sp.]CAA9520419.1 MAG: FIG00635939: hypothetical protein [uncultured Sphingosinicella sp.]
MRLLVITAALLASTASAQSGGPFMLVEKGQRFARLQDAVNAVGGGSATIQIAPGTYRDCAVQEAGRIAYVARMPGTAIFDGGTCEGKAALVLRGQSAHVEGLTFRRQFVPDGNGAGIRIEKGDLEVVETLFADGQCGILSADDPESSITVERSTFSGLGKHPDGTGAHALYIGGYRALRVTNTRFERGTGGHYLKSRAARIEVLDSSFDDSQGRSTNYHIDLPNGAVGRIARNTFAQGRNKENYSTMITVAPEGAQQSSEGLVIENNKASVVPGFPWTTTFVGAWTPESVVVRNNDLGQGIRSYARR